MILLYQLHRHLEALLSAEMEIPLSTTLSGIHIDLMSARAETALRAPAGGAFNVTAQEERKLHHALAQRIVRYVTEAFRISTVQDVNDRASLEHNLPTSVTKRLGSLALWIDAQRGVFWHIHLTPPLLTTLQSLVLTGADQIVQPFSTQLVKLRLSYGRLFGTRSPLAIAGHGIFLSIVSMWTTLYITIFLVFCNGIY